MRDGRICLYGACCLPCLNGLNYSKVRGEDCTVCHCCAFHHPFWIRKELVKRSGAEAQVGDSSICCAACCCAPCAVCQDARALV